jgi:hypothetical protein
MCRDHKAPGRDHYASETTVADERRADVHVGNGAGENAFVVMRNARDATLAAPTLLLPSIQVNIRDERFPAAEQNGVHYLQIPVKTEERRRSAGGRRTAARQVASGHAGRRDRQLSRIINPSFGRSTIAPLTRSPVRS